MREIIRWTLWQRRWFIGWWAFGIAAFMILSLAFYPTFRDQAVEINRAIGQLPEAAKALFTDTDSFTTPQDFLSGRVFYLMLPLLLIVMAIIGGSSLISKEEEQGTIEMLLARPISRSKFLAAKALAGLIILSVVSIVALLTGLIVGWLVDIEVLVLNIEVATLFAAILALLFGALAFTITTLGTFARAAAAGVAASIAISSYVVVSLSSVVEWLKWPAKILPHNYYHPSQILYGDYDWPNAVGLLLAVAAIAAIAYWSFNRRDIGV